MWMEATVARSAVATAGLRVMAAMLLRGPSRRVCAIPGLASREFVPPPRTIFDITDAPTPTARLGRDIRPRLQGWAATSDPAAKRETAGLAYASADRMIL